MLALRRVGEVARERAIIETEAVVIRGYEHQALWRFFPGAELNADVSNWWAPNIAALVGALRPAGVAPAGGKRGAAREEVDSAERDPLHYRAIVHGVKRPEGADGATGFA